MEKRRMRKQRVPEPEHPLLEMGWAELEAHYESTDTRQRAAYNAGKVRLAWKLLRQMDEIGGAMKSRFPEEYGGRQERICQQIAGGRP